VEQCKGSNNGSFSAPSENIISDLYPNPTSDIITVLFQCMSENEMVRVTVLDVVGKSVLRQNLICSQGKNELNLNVESLPTGLYLLKVQIGAQTELKRLILN
ncbi:MAG: T9SS type A sorting domain-containing protein, partial [Bacteroidia bacterium]|nr:T9SS type A sorting domain-containing protein [Bacteroidia bacterium]